MVIKNGKQTSFAIPNKYITNYTLFDNFEFEVISKLCQLKDIKGYWKGHIKGLLNFSNIDVRYKNKALQFIRSIGGTTDNDYVVIYVNGLFNFKSNTLSDFLLVDYDIYDSFENKELFKYYCYMLYNINMFSGCFIQTYKQLISSTGISKTTLLKYNEKLMNDNYIYHINSGDMYDESTNRVINSSNFYSTNMATAEKELENYIQTKTNAFGWTKDYEEKEITPNDKRKASQYIRIYGGLNDLTKEQYEKLVWGCNIHMKLNRIDYCDSEKVERVKINSLVKKYENLGFNYSVCKDLLYGNIDLYYAIDHYGK